MGRNVRQAQSQKPRDLVRVNSRRDRVNLGAEIRGPRYSRASERQMLRVGRWED